MKLLSKLSIRGKLILTILSVIVITSVIGLSVIIYSHIRTVRKDMINNLEMETKLISEYCVTPLTFADNKGAVEVLDKLRSIPSIVRGELYDEHGKLFAVYNNAKFASKDTANNVNIKNFFKDNNVNSAFKIINRNIYLYSAVSYKNEKYGKIYIIASTKEYVAQINRYIVLMGALMLFLLIFSILLANFFQKFISKPILELAEFTDMVSLSKDYSIRLDKRNSQDEIAILYDGFNKMLEQIANREMERDLAESALRESENKNRSLINALPDLIFIFDRNKRIIYYKSRKIGKHDVSHDYKNLNDIIKTESHLSLFNTYIEKSFKSKKVQAFEYNINDDDHIGYFEYRLVALNDNEILCIVRDITELKSTENQLAIEKIRAAAAEEADKLKSAFLANMSHEIRTPMNAIIGFSNLLRDSQTTEEEKVEYIEIINKSGDNLIHLIDDIIDFSKIEAGQLVINKAECNITRILRDMHIFFEKDKTTKRKEHIAFILNLPERYSEIILNTDEYRFKQVMTNLLFNALKFTEKGAIEFGYIIDNTKSEILFYVKDTGIGIAKDSLNEIFERFKKLEDKKSKLYGGAGLGLAICKNLIESLGGKIWVESIKGEGSTFYFTLPYINMHKEETKNIMDKNINQNYNWTGKTILVVEDEEYVCKFFERILNPTKANIIWSHNGLEAVDIFKQNSSIDIILMDMKMPELNGYEAVKRIKLLNNSVPVIAQTAYALVEDKIKCLEAGCDDYMSKPIDPVLLMEKINKFLCK